MLFRSIIDSVERVLRVPGNNATFLTASAITERTPRSEAKSQNVLASRALTANWRLASRRRTPSPVPLALPLLSSRPPRRSLFLSRLPYVSSPQLRHLTPRFTHTISPDPSRSHSLALSVPLTHPILSSLSLPNAAPCYDLHRSCSPAVLLKRVNPLFLTLRSTHVLFLSLSAAALPLSPRLPFHRFSALAGFPSPSSPCSPPRPRRRQRRR